MLSTLTSSAFSQSRVDVLETCKQKLITMNSVCANPTCGKEGSLCCSTCKSERYCSKDCQKEHWKIHKQSFLHKKLPMPSIDQEYAKRYPKDTLNIPIVKAGSKVIRDMIDSSVKRLFVVDKDFFRHRWNIEVNDNLLSFIRDASPGDIYQHRRYVPYNSEPQHFRNTPPIGIAQLTNGTTVIDIGFVDFGITIDAVGSIQHGEEPVTVHALDKEPMCVAKCLVMLEMMKKMEVSPRSVLEVWMSTLWSQATLLAFTAAVRSLLLLPITHGTSNKQVRSSLQPEVRAVLQFWQSAPPVTRDAALVFWTLRHIERIAEAVMRACNLASEADRVALLRYKLIGALYEDATTTVGSVVMCTENSDLGIKQGGESCIQALPTFVHLERHTVPFLERLRGYFSEKIALFATHLRNGTLVFLPRVANLSADSTALLTELRALNPYVVSWSNVNDYMHPTAFHAMARRITGPETVHFVHSCNWTMNVYGVDAYEMPEHLRGSLFEAGMKCFGATQQALGFAAVPISHHRNFSRQPLIRKYINHYLRFFFKGQPDVKMAAWTDDGLLPIPDPFLRSSQTAHWMMSYGKVTFGANSYDYTKEG